MRAALTKFANESIDVANFVKAARIYAYAIVALCA